MTNEEITYLKKYITIKDCEYYLFYNKILKKKFKHIQFGALPMKDFTEKPWIYMYIYFEDNTITDFYAYVFEFVNMYKRKLLTEKI